MRLGPDPTHNAMTYEPCCLSQLLSTKLDPHNKWNRLKVDYA